MHTIWTIGHSTRSLEEFVSILHSFSILQLVDIRRYPGSKKYPHFNQCNLKAALASASIEYHHLEALGGRRKPQLISDNMGWRHQAFRGYADYMQTPQFNDCMQQLQQIAINNPTSYMCSEALWWKCHRALISDYLKLEGWEVNHIMNFSTAKAHSYTSPARIIHGLLKYPKQEEV